MLTLRVLKHAVCAYGKVVSNWCLDFWNKLFRQLAKLRFSDGAVASPLQSLRILWYKARKTAKPVTAQYAM